MNKMMINPECVVSIFCLTTSLWLGMNKINKRLKRMKA